MTALIVGAVLRAAFLLAVGTFAMHQVLNALGTPVGVLDAAVVFVGAVVAVAAGRNLA